MDKKALKKALTAIVSRLEKTEKFVLEQAPDVCKQMVKEKSFDHTVDLTLHLGGAVIGLFVVGACFAIGYNNQVFEYLMPCGIVGVLGGVGGLCSASCAVWNIKYLYYIKNCTKLFLLREFTDLLGE